LCLHLVHDLSVRQISLALAVRLHLLKLLDRALEFLTRLVQVPLRLVSLLFQKCKLALPESLVLVIVIDGVLVLAFHLSTLFTRSVKLLTDCLLVRSERL
jgi:hypothetical protein